MSEASSVPAIADLPWIAYLDESGNISDEFAGKIGVYAIFDSDSLQDASRRNLQYVGISRDIATSLKLHMVRVPALCHWVKVTTVTKPNRTLLAEIQTAWLGDKVLNAEQLELWEQPLNCQKLMTDAEKQLLAQAMNEAEQEKVLKNVARRVEKDILAQLEARGVKFEVRFNPKRKNEGILDMK